MGRELCEKISNKVANCVRTTFSICKSFRKTGELIKKGTDSIAFSAKRLGAKLGNLRKRISAESRFASYDEKQKVVLFELGGEVFYGVEDDKKDMFSHEHIKDLLKEARDYEIRKQEIKEEINLQKRRMDERVIFRRATFDLEDDDPRVRRVAIRVLKRLDNRTAIPYLMKCLEDSDPEVRKMAQNALHFLLKKVKTPKETGKPRDIHNPTEMDKEENENPHPEELDSELKESQ